MKKENIRQGDLLFIPVPPKKGYQLHKNKNHGYRKDGIIQEGEATGHHHRLKDPLSADVYRPDYGFPFIVVHGQPAEVVHDGSARVDSNFHSPAVLEAGRTYEVHIDREDDGTGQTRQVID